MGPGFRWDDDAGANTLEIVIPAQAGIQRRSLHE
jgi:hypothetical protein